MCHAEIQAEENLGVGGRCAGPSLYFFHSELQVTELGASPGSRGKAVTTVQRAPWCGNDGLPCRPGRKGCCHARVEILNAALSGQSAGTASAPGTATRELIPSVAASAGAPVARGAAAALATQCRPKPSPLWRTEVLGCRVLLAGGSPRPGGNKSRKDTRFYEKGNRTAGRPLKDGSSVSQTLKDLYLSHSQCAAAVCTELLASQPQEDEGPAGR